MITGKVTANREVVIEIEVAGPAQQLRRTQAVIDTGYNGYLTLPRQLVSALKLPFAGHRRGTLADGRTVLLDVFLARSNGTASDKTSSFRRQSERHSSACRSFGAVAFQLTLWTEGHPDRDAPARRALIPRRTRLG